MLYDRQRCRYCNAYIPTVWLLFTAILLVAPLANAQTVSDDQLRTLTAFGSGEVRVRPDIAEVRVGVETEATTAAGARSENAARAQKVVAAVKALGITEASIQTSMFQIEPVRRSDKPDQVGEPPIVGYRVMNIVSIRTEKLDAVAKIIDESIKAGANRVEGVNFQLKDEDAPRQAALREAAADARRNAQSLADELKVTLVRIQTIQQGSVGVMPPPMLFREAAIGAAAETPILPGEVTVSASVTAMYVIQ
jgi:uncharacterized protein